MKVCQRCKKERELSEFKEYRKNTCRECYNIYQKDLMNKRASNLEGYLQAQIINIRNHKTRSKHELNLDLDFLKELYNKQNGKCALSNIELQIGYNRKNPYTLSIDRIDSDKGYTKDNVQLVIAAINTFKANYNVKDIFDITLKFAENIRMK